MTTTEKIQYLNTRERYGFEDLVLLVEVLRSEQGCPWDREQNHQSIRKDLIEETYEVAEAIEGDFDVAVVGLFGADAKPRQLEVLKAVMGKGRPVVAVLLKSPYEARYAKDCNAVITSYGYVTLSAKATVEAMKRNDYRGKLPVTLDE